MYLTPYNRCECIASTRTQWLQGSDYAPAGIGNMQHHGKEESSCGQVFATFYQGTCTLYHVTAVDAQHQHSCQQRFCACRDREDTASRRKAVELYKVLQRIMQEEHDFDNDQNAMVLRVLSDTLESLQQYGEPLCRFVK
jgi:hypothetical protein